MNCIPCQNKLNKRVLIDQALPLQTDLYEYGKKTSANKKNNNKKNTI